ncbi:MAG: hypothetical protein EXS32_08955 [Opitutus sp.]|nr:hypothetical protein [Opitutus sp.]
MLKRLLLPCLLLAAVLSAGCLHSKKTAKPKDSSALASDLEESFKQRWVEKRTAELVAQGTTADAARPQAIAEFRVQYGFTSAAQK